MTEPQRLTAEKTCDGDAMRPTGGPDPAPADEARGRPPKKNPRELRAAIWPRRRHAAPDTTETPRGPGAKCFGHWFKADAADPSCAAPIAMGTRDRR